MKTFLAAALLLAAPWELCAQKREYVELQRDVATLQDQVRTLQRAFDEKMTALTVLVQQTLDSANNANKGMAVLEARVNDRLADQEKKMTLPVATVGEKIDRMSTEFTQARENLSDVLARLGKLEQKMVDLSNEVRTMNTPAPPPPGSTTGAAGGAPTMPAEQLYENARRDTAGGKSDLGLQQFAEYLKFYPNTENASNAQYWIGQIYYDKADYEAALKNFDLVIENYPDGRKVADAIYMKGQTLLKMTGRRSDAAKEFRRLYADYPKHELAAKACTELKKMGFSSCASPATRRR
ncbi:MAG: outer membrane protein assembly factor BamD [Bryobacteraceae bacterium]